MEGGHHSCLGEMRWPESFKAVFWGGGLVYSFVTGGGGRRICKVCKEGEGLL